MARVSFGFKRKNRKIKGTGVFLRNPRLRSWVGASPIGWDPLTEENLVIEQLLTEFWDMIRHAKT